MGLQDKGWDVAKLVNKSGFLVECAFAPCRPPVTASGTAKMLEMLSFLLSLPGIDLNVRGRFNETENLLTTLVRNHGDERIDVIRLILKVCVGGNVTLILYSLMILNDDCRMHIFRISFNFQKRGDGGVLKSYKML